MMSPPRNSLTAQLAVLAIWCAVMGGPALLHAGESRPARFSAVELRQQLITANDRVRSFYVCYTTVSLRGADAAAGISVIREVAAASPSSFFHWSRKGTREYSPQDDPLQQRLTVIDGVAIVEHPTDRSFAVGHVNRHDPLPGSAPRELLFFALGWWPLRDFQTPRLVPGTAEVLTDVASSPNYSVQPNQELIRGRWCHVLKHVGHDKLWIDVERGCAIMAREVADPVTQLVAQRVDCFDHREVCEGVWAPAIIRSRLFVQGRQDVEADTEIRISAIDVNGTPPSVLRAFQPRPGSIELAGDQFEQRIAGGTDLLDEVAGRLKKMAPLPNPIQPRSAIDAATVAANMAGCALVLTIAGLRRRVFILPGNDTKRAGIPLGPSESRHDVPTT